MVIVFSPIEKENSGNLGEWGNIYLPHSCTCLQDTPYRHVHEAKDNVKKTDMDFPDESACQCRGHGFSPWAGKIPQNAGRATKPVCHKNYSPHA